MDATVLSISNDVERYFRLATDRFELLAIIELMQHDFNDYHIQSVEQTDRNGSGGHRSIGRRLWRRDAVVGNATHEHIGAGWQ